MPFNLSSRTPASYGKEEKKTQISILITSKNSRISHRKVQYTIMTNTKNKK